MEEHSHLQWVEGVYLEWEEPAEQYLRNLQQPHLLHSEEWEAEWAAAWEAEWEEVWAAAWEEAWEVWEEWEEHQVQAGAALLEALQAACLEIWAPNPSENLLLTYLEGWEEWAEGLQLPRQTSSAVAGASNAG